MTSLVPCALALLLTTPLTAVRAYENGQYTQALHLAQQTLAQARPQAVSALEPELAAQPDGLVPKDLQRPKAIACAAEVSALTDARLVEALALYRLGRLGEAASKLSQLDDEGLDLGPQMVLLRLRLAQALHHCDDAQALADTLPQSSELQAEAWLVTAQCRVQAGDTPGAIIALHNIEGRDGPEGAVTQAQALMGRLAETMGQPQKAAKIYRELLTRFAWTTAARRVAPRFSALRRRGIHIEPITPIDSLLPIAAHQRDTRQYNAARQSLHRLENQARHARRNDWLSQAQIGLIELDIVDRNYTEGKSLAHAILRRNPPSDVRAQALFLEGDILGRQGHVRQALSALAQAQMQGPGAPFAQLAALSAARLAFATAHAELAQAHVHWLLAQAPVSYEVSLVRDDGVPLPINSDSVTDGAWWLDAWMLLQAHAPPDAVRQALEHVRPTGDFADAALFWQARLAENDHNLQGARAFASALARRAPTSFYAMLSMHLLNRVQMCRNEPTQPSFAWTQLADPATSERLRPKARATDSLAAQYLLDHGLISEARRMLRALPHSGLSDSDRIVTASLYRRLGQTTRAVNLTRHVVVDQSRLEPALIELAFPRPYARLVQRAAAQYHVPPALIYAIMREESSFDADAESPRQAYGLMQLILPTAQRLARAAHVKHVKTRGLRSPEVSIRLGAYYLSELLRHTQGNLVATVAAYQAGEGNVRHWLRGREMMQPEAFAEEIPYTSTRQYVRDVLGDYGVYSLILGSSPQAPMRLTPEMAGTEQASVLPFAVPGAR